MRPIAWREDATLTATDRRVLETLEGLYGTRPVAPEAPRPATTKRPVRSGHLALRTILLVAAAVSLVMTTPQGRSMYDHVAEGATSLLADLQDR